MHEWMTAWNKWRDAWLDGCMKLTTDLIHDMKRIEMTCNEMKVKYLAYIAAS